MSVNLRVFVFLYNFLKMNLVSLFYVWAVKQNNSCLLLQVEC